MADTPRDPETIIADFLAGFVGDDSGLDYRRPSARMLIGWLRDEGWLIAPAVMPSSEPHDV